MYVAVAGLFFAACSGAPLPGDFDLAQAKERAHDDEGALAIWQRAATDCAKVGAPRRSHDDCALALVRTAQLQEKLLRFPAAYQSWLGVPLRTHDPRTAARALARAAILAADELHDDAAAEKWAWGCIERFPDEVPADDALALVVRLGRRENPAALAARLQALYPSVAHQDIADNILYALAELHRDANDPQGAIAIFDQLANTYPHSGLRDDAIWHAAELARDAGDAHGALRRLQRILDSRRDALITGSYNSLYLDDAQMLVGRIWLDDLHDAERACDAFHTLAFDYPESILKDDALYELARAELARHAPPTDGDKHDACAALVRLRTKYPDSNQLRKARALEEQLACR